MSCDPVVCQTCDKRDNCDSHEAVKEQMLGAQEVMAGFARIGRGAYEKELIDLIPDQLPQALLGMREVQMTFEPYVNILARAGHTPEDATEAMDLAERVARELHEAKEAAAVEAGNIADVDAMEEVVKKDLAEHNGELAPDDPITLRGERNDRPTP